MPTDSTYKTRHALPQAFWAELSQALPASALQNHVGDEFLTEWRGRWHGHTPLLARPENVDQVSALVQLCTEYRVPLTPQGGNTGLVGGQIPQGEVLLSLSRLEKFVQVDEQAGTLTTSASVTVREAQEAASEAGWLFPLDIASADTATIGGAVSTNAGGMGVLRYGTMRHLVLGLQAVLPDGHVWNELSPLFKDNTGYDFKQLLIGAEGTLGVITKASLRLYRPPVQTLTAWAGLRRVEDGLVLLSRLRLELGEQVSKFELVSDFALSLVCKHMPGAKSPLSGEHKWHVLIELGLVHGNSMREVAENALAQTLKDGLAQDLVLAQSASQAHNMVQLRESISAAQKPEGVAYKHDISLPLSRVGEFLNHIEPELYGILPGLRTVAFGHVGDGNLHFNLLQPQGAERETAESYREPIQRAVDNMVQDMGGSFSAEHGIGIAKRGELARFQPKKRSILHKIKKTLDPHNVMNPRAIF